MKYFLFILSVLFLSNSLSAQIDTIITKEGNILSGEIKDLERGVLKIETEYSDKDFEIEWKGLEQIKTQSDFLITIADGRRLNGKLESNSAGNVLIKSDNKVIGITKMDEIVFLQSIDKNFGSRFSASIDFSFSVTKAQELRQFNLRGTLKYQAERWSTSVSYNRLRSSQTETEALDRSDGNITYQYFLQNDYYYLTQVDLLSNDEQKLDLRTTGKLGVGKYLVHTNQINFGFAAGLNFNNEQFSDENPDRNSLEGFVGTELNMFDLGDLNLLTRVVAYPSLTESGRFRSDLVFDAKYDLPLDFYVKLGLTLNYDNQPVSGASETDYIFQSGIGWEW